MRIAITGGRDYKPTRRDVLTFLRIFREMGGSTLLHGDAMGVDRYVAAVVRAEMPEVAIEPFLANWKLYGKAAGPIRNRDMLATADGLIAFPGGKGTADCVRQARSLGRPVREVATEPRDPVATPPWTESLPVTEWTPGTLPHGAGGWPRGDRRTSKRRP